MRPKIYIFDASNMIHRAFHAFTDLANSEGFPTGAIWGTTKMLLRFIEKNKPTHIIMAYDSQNGSGIRKSIYPEYKANRPQVNAVGIEERIIRRLIELLNIKGIEVTGYEADDVIASCVKTLSKDADIVIVTGDKDMLQLIGSGVSVYDSMKDVHYGDAEVEKKFGVRSSQISDFLAIAGDSADNIPGVRGIGPKGAQQLLKSYNSIEEVYENIDKVPEKLRSKLEASKDMAKISKQLTSLFSDLLPNLLVEEVEFKPIPNEDIFRIFDKLEFRNIRYDVELMWQEYDAK